MNEKIQVSDTTLLIIKESLIVLKKEINCNQKISPGEVSRIIEIISIIQKTFIPFTERDIEYIVLDWKMFYQKYFGIRPEFLSDILIPKKNPGYSRLLMIPKGMTTERMYSFLVEFIPCFRWSMSTKTDDFDEITENVRNSKQKGYAVWVKDELDAENSLQGYPDLLSRIGINGITLLEYFVLFAKCLDENKKNILDCNGATLCLGTVYKKDIENVSNIPLWNVFVPIVYMNGTRLTIKGVQYKQFDESNQSIIISLDEAYQIKIRARSVIEFKEIDK